MAVISRNSLKLGDLEFEIGRLRMILGIRTIFQVILEKYYAQKHLTSFENNQNTRKFEYDLYHPHSIHWNPLSSPFHSTICPNSLPPKSCATNVGLRQDFYWKIVHFQKISICHVCGFTDIGLRKRSSERYQVIFYSCTPDFVILAGTVF